jgi:hypothetical protein
MNPTTKFLVTCGGIAGDIKSELGSRTKVRSIRPNEPVGDYGDFIFESSGSDAVLMKLKYPAVVTILYPNECVFDALIPEVRDEARATI